MGIVSRTSPVKEYLELNPCPYCNGDVIVTDCGYSSFNPGSARCIACQRTWALGYVDDAWQAGERWNKFMPVVREIEALEHRAQELRKQAGVPMQWRNGMSCNS